MCIQRRFRPGRSAVTWTAAGTITTESPDLREPGGDQIGHRSLAPAIEVIAVGHNANRARSGGALGEGLGGIELARLPVAAQVKDGTADAPGGVEERRAVLQRIDEAGGARHVPPAG